MRPLGERLRQQRQTGHQKQHPLAGTGQPLGNLQAGKGLAGAAGHDQLAAFGIFEACCNSIQRGFLVIPKLLAGLESNSLVGLVLGPVDLTVFQGL
ncbi:hypothetical protein D3C84_797990 [compost metagenome]